jgi:UDP-glucose 6-dehydrogenase
MSESKLKYFSTTARAAEICEYMENWLADTRIGSSHSSVTAQRGFRGRCLPKKISAIVAAMQPYGGSPLLEAVMEYNTRLGAVADAAKSVPA